MGAERPMLAPGEAERLGLMEIPQDKLDELMAWARERVALVGQDSAENLIKAAYKLGFIHGTAQATHCPELHLFDRPKCTHCGAPVPWHEAAVADDSGVYHKACYQSRKGQIGQ